MVSLHPLLVTSSRALLLTGALGRGSEKMELPLFGGWCVRTEGQAQRGAWAHSRPWCHQELSEAMEQCRPLQKHRVRRQGSRQRLQTSHLIYSFFTLTTRAL